ncbi:MAG: hypothetical protein ABS36_10880 [Acidobacteria bacterium SCN 69-37]|nr:MAG: hypothetical protein ABS36_10880 [Acidobacteria bacterium SCN 69-37]
MIRRDDLAAAWRRSKAAPLFTIFSIVTIAFGVAAVMVTCALVRAVAAPPPGVADVHDLLTLSHTKTGGPAMFGFSLEDFHDLQRRQTTMRDVIAFASMTHVIVADGQSRTGIGELVSGGYFPLLGVSASLGRLIQPHDDQPGAPPVVVIGDDVWRGMFGGRPDIVGRQVTLGGHAFEVIGVAPRSFVGLFSNGRFPATVWVPLSTAPLFERIDFERRRANRDARWLYLRARPVPGVTIGQVAVDLTAIGRQLDAEFPIGRDLSPAFTPLPYQVSRPWVVRRSQDLMMDESATEFGPPIAALLIAAVSLVLLVACTNLANLIVARGVTRRQELAIRMALGASRARLVFGTTLDVLVMSAIGGGLGFAISALLMRGLSHPVTAGGGVSLLLQPRLDPVVWIAGIGAMVAAAVVAGVVPGWWLSRQGHRAALDASGSPTVVPRWRGRRALIAGQVAVSMALLATASVFIGEITAAGRFTGGTDLDSLAVAAVDLPLQGIDAARTTRLVEGVIDRLTRHPAIASAAVSAGFPFRRPGWVGTVVRQGPPIPVQVIAVSGPFFRTAGIDLVAGTGLDGRDTDNTAVVIDVALARLVFGRDDVVGQPITIVRNGQGATPAGESRTIVGLAASTAGHVRQPMLAIYEPLIGRPDVPLFFIARAKDDPVRRLEDVRAALVTIEPAIGLANLHTGREMFGPVTDVSVAAGSIATLLGMAGLAIVLSGLYGVLSHLVTIRTREIGMRLALGATPRHVLLMVIRQGVAPVLVGAVAGGIVAMLLRQVITSTLFLPDSAGGGVIAILVVPVTILLATVMACYVPARRAARIDPTAALKQ